MAQIYAYLTFNGNCKEAMSFYQACLGGNLNFQTVGESPKSEDLPVQMKKSILHATLEKDELILMGSDMVSEDGLLKGNAVSLMLECSTPEEIKETYALLVAGGKSTHPIETTFWGALLGGLTDKYGNRWLLHHNRSTSKN